MSDKRRDALVITVRHTKTPIASSFCVTEKTDLNIDYSKADEYIPEIKPKQGWDQRGARESLYGDSYLQNYKDSIKCMFEEGEKTVERK